ncbi:hypothetical protein [Telmatospirillum sp. J64-1]|uniref:hypothetical protein n=1 Tax=Telmatospirillum sp. J64-1 TaxID=2502183 RepID=UPI00115DAD9E|nr:hypothetical protein [Telmatospirillum sp. J64-1]
MSAKIFDLNLLSLDTQGGTAAFLIAPTGRIVWFMMTGDDLLANVEDDGFLPRGTDMTLEAATAGKAVAKAKDMLRELGWTGEPWTVAHSVHHALHGLELGEAIHIARANAIAIAGSLHRMAHDPKQTHAQPIMGRLDTRLEASMLPPLARQRLRRMAELLVVVKLGLTPNAELARDGLGRGDLNWLDTATPTPFPGKPQPDAAEAKRAAA